MSNGGCGRGGVGWRVWGGGSAMGGGSQGGGACAEPTTTTCIPPGGMCVWGGFGDTAYKDRAQLPPCGGPYARYNLDKGVAYTKGGGGYFSFWGNWGLGGCTAYSCQGVF